MPKHTMRHPPTGPPTIPPAMRATSRGNAVTGGMARRPRRPGRKCRTARHGRHRDTQPQAHHQPSHTTHPAPDLLRARPGPVGSATLQQTKERPALFCYWRASAYTNLKWAQNHSNEGDRTDVEYSQHYLQDILQVVGHTAQPRTRGARLRRACEPTSAVRVPGACQRRSRSASGTALVPSPWPCRR